MTSPIRLNPRPKAEPRSPVPWWLLSKERPPQRSLQNRDICRWNTPSYVTRVRNPASPCPIGWQFLPEPDLHVNVLPRLALAPPSIREYLPVLRPPAKFYSVALQKNVCEQRTGSAVSATTKRANKSQ